MSIMDMFRSPPPAQQGTQGQPPQRNQDPLNPQGGDPAATEARLAEERRQQELNDKNKSPLADFANLWDTPTLKDGETPPTDWDDPSSLVPTMNLDPAKISEVSKRLDFSKALNPEKVKLALGGDVNAFTEVINSALQAAFANSSMATARFTEATLRKMAPSLIEALPHHIRKHTVRDTLSGESAAFNDPAVAPVMEAIEGRLRARFPKASAKEITEHAKKYMSGVVDLFGGGKGAGDNSGSGRPAKAGQKTGLGNEDWTDFFVPPNQQ